MGIRPYIDDDLAAGRLVAPFALTVPKGMRWYLVYRSFQTEQRDFAAFRRWIIRAAAGPASRQAGGARSPNAGEPHAGMMGRRRFPPSGHEK
jgi:LysR family glycine cleavage system transcriptional activator